MGYTAEYTRLYPDGYVNLPDESTPEMAEQMNLRDDTIIKIEQFLAELNIELGGEYAQLAEAGHSINLDVDEAYVLTIKLLNKAGAELSSKSVDLPIEAMIVDVDYADGYLTLTLQNGNTVEVGISEIVSGLVQETRKIAGIDLVNDVTAGELVEAERKVPGEVYVKFEEPEEAEVVMWEYLPYPVAENGEKLPGNNGDFLVSNGDGSTSWVSLDVAEGGAY